MTTNLQRDELEKVTRGHTSTSASRGARGPCPSGEILAPLVGTCTVSTALEKDITDKVCKDKDRLPRMFDCTAVYRLPLF